VVANVGVILAKYLPNASNFISSWQAFVAKSSVVKISFFEFFNRACPYITNFTRWYSEYDDVVYVFHEIKYENLCRFVKQFAETNPAASASTCNTIQKLIQANGNDIQLELAVYVDYGYQLTKCCYFLEGDAILMPFAYDQLNYTFSTFDAKKEFKSVTSYTLKALAGSDGALLDALKKRVTNIISQTSEYFKSHIFPVIPNCSDEKFLKNKGLKRTVDVAKFARILNPQRVNTVLDSYDTLLSLANAADLPGVDTDFVKALFREVPKYKNIAENYVPAVGENLPEKARIFFSQHRADLPKFCNLYKIIALAQPSSACVERLNSCFDVVIGKTGISAAVETCEAQTMMRYNYKKLKLEVKGKRPNKRIPPQI
jgi:hypothetical protein